MRRTWYAALVVLLLLAGGTGDNQALAARKTAVILGISGPRGTHIRKSLVQLVSRSRIVNLISSRRYTRLARKQGRLVAARVLQVSGIVSGTITRSGRRWILRVRVASGHNLRTVGSTTTLMRGARLDPATSRRVAARVGQAMARTRAGPPVARTKRPRPRRSKPVKLAHLGRVPIQRSTPLPRSSEGPEACSPAASPVPPGEDPDHLRLRQSAAKGTREPWEKLVEVSAGMMLLSRNMSIEPPKGGSNFRNIPSYHSGLSPAIRLEGALYPLRYLHDSLANLGLTVRYFRAFGFTYLLKGMPSLRASLDVFEGGLRRRWNILGKRSSPTLNLGLELGRMSFVIDNDEDFSVYLPNLSYLYLKMEAGIDVPLYASRSFSFGLFGHLDYLPILSGKIEETEVGYGPQPSGGLEFAAGLFASYKGFFGRVSGFYRQVFHSFDACQGCEDDGSADDLYRGFALVGGYAH